MVTINRIKGINFFSSLYSSPDKNRSMVCYPMNSFKCLEKMKISEQVSDKH